MSEPRPRAPRPELLDLLAANRGREGELYRRFVNPQKADMLRLVGLDADYASSRGAWLTRRDGRRILDTVTHSGVSSVGHSHPHVAATLRAVLAADLPNFVQMLCSLLAGLLAERLLGTAPHLGKAYFGSSGAEAVETALKLARGHTRRPRILFFEGAYHGLTYGALSCAGHEMWREGFGPFLEGCTPIPFSDAAALERELRRGDVACLLGETLIGDGGVLLPGDGFWPEAARLCREHGALLVLDEIQVGLGRTGRLHAYQHYGVEPDVLLLGKALSGGYAPVSAVLMRDEVHASVFSSLARSFVHFGTYSENNLALAAAWATLDVLEDEDLVARAERTGRALLERLRPLRERYELVHDVRGVGLFVGIELGRPRALGPRATFELLDRMHGGLVGQMIVMALFRRHGILAQLGGHNVRVLKLMPPLGIGAEEVDRIADALEETLAASQRFPGAMWSEALELARRAALG
jgi:ornithine--oxo-acid transaminase